MPPVSTHAANLDQPAPISRAQFLRVFPSVCLPMFLASVDQTIVAAALPNIAGSLNDVERISWVVVAYLMATTIAAPVYGRLGDVFGRKRLMFVALFVFIGASLACALASSMVGLILARLVQGAGGGGLMTLSQALIGEIVPPRERPRFQGYMAGTFMVASTFGPVAGGWLTQHWGWPSVFLINLPLGALAVGLAVRLPARPGAGGTFRFDWLGMALLAGFVVALLLALERVQRVSLAALPLVAVLVALSAACLSLLLRQERRAASPLIPLGVLRDGSIWRCDIMAACIGGMLVGGITFMPIYLEVVRGADPAQIGLLMLPLTAGVALGAIVTGRLMVRTGRTAIFPSIGQILAGLGWATLALVGDRLSIHWLPVLFLFTALATGTTMPVVQLTVQIAAGPKHLGAASASVQFTRSIGAALGTALIGSVLFATLALQDGRAAALFGEVVERGPDVLLHAAPALRALLASDIVAAFRAAFLVIVALSLCCLSMAWTLPLRRL